MGFLEELVTQPQAPAPPDDRIKYVVMGVWNDAGELTRPDRLVVELSGGRSTEKPGDTVRLTRDEATVLGRYVMLGPVL